MLYIVLILVLAALGLLVTALITATSLWAWASIVLSVVAGVVLIADWVRRRGSRTRAEAKTVKKADAEAGSEEDEDTAEAAEAAEHREPGERAAAVAEPDETERTELIRVTGELDEDQIPGVDTGDPAEEATAPADAKAVAKLRTEVLVVDEYPRYHVAECRWLAGRETIPISVAEARDLGFTPCARCTPDAKLLAGTAQRRS